MTKWKGVFASDKKSVIDWKHERYITGSEVAGV